MRVFLIVGFVAITSMGGYLYGRNVVRFPRRELIEAWEATLECVWFGLVFFAFNVLVGFVWVLVLRATIGHFVSLYVLTDMTLPIFSLFQGIIFQLWRREAVRGRSL